MSSLMASSVNFLCKNLGIRKVNLPLYALSSSGSGILCLVFKVAASHSRLASSIFLSASSTVEPSLKQPFNKGMRARKPPPLAGAIWVISTG